MGNLKKIALPAGIIVVVAAIVTILIVFLAGGDEEVYRLIKINRFEGAVTVERGEVMDAFEGLQLVSEDIVQTGAGSTVELLADSDKHILAEENTTFVVEATGTEKNGKIKINLLYGRSLFTIDNKLNEDSYFEVTTPNAAMSVRGTSFWVEYIPEEDTTIVEVIEGVVETNYYGAKELLKAGEERVITPEFSESDNQTDSSVTETTLPEETTTAEETTTPEIAETAVPAVTTAPVVTTAPEGTTALTVLPEETTVPETTTVPVETTETTTVPTETTVPETTTRRSSSSSRPSTTTAETTTTTTTTETTPPLNGYTTYFIGDASNIDRSATQYNLENGRLVTAYLYDTDGNLVYCNMYEYNNSTVTVKLLQADLSTLDAEYLLDEDGKRIKDTTYNPDGTIKDCSEYDENENRTRYTTYYYSNDVLRYYYVLDYNEDHQVIRETTYNPDDSISNYNTYEYHANGNIKKSDLYNTDDEITESKEYNENGKLIKRTVYDNGNIHTETEYDENNGKMTKNTVYNDDGSRTESEYNENIRTTKETRYKTDGTKTVTEYTYESDGMTLESYTVIEYDSDGNETSRNNYDADGNPIP